MWFNIGLVCISTIPIGWKLGWPLPCNESFHVIDQAYHWEFSSSQMLLFFASMIFTFLHFCLWTHLNPYGTTSLVIRTLCVGWDFFFFWVGVITFYLSQFLDYGTTQKLNKRNWWVLIKLKIKIKNKKLRNMILNEIYKVDWEFFFFFFFFLWIVLLEYF